MVKSYNNAKKMMVELLQNGGDTDVVCTHVNNAFNDMFKVSEIMADIIREAKVEFAPKHPLDDFMPNVGPMPEVDVDMGDIFKEACKCSADEAPDYAFVDTSIVSDKAVFQTANSKDVIVDYIQQRCAPKDKVVVFKKVSIMELDALPVTETEFKV